MAVIAPLKHKARGLPDLESQLRRDHAIGATANAIRAKIPPFHERPVVVLASTYS
jgi:hypothetical protein